MKDTTRRVVILKNINSDFIEETILILKDSAESGDSRLLCEAEKIVEKYMSTCKEKNRTSRKPMYLPAICMGTVFVVVGVALILFFS